MLNGIRIIEVEGLGPAPFTGMLLADLGADVIVVHRKGGNATPGLPKNSLMDRGKRSIALDLKDPDDVATFFRLVETADGLIEGFRPGVMEKLGLSPETCHAVNPALVFGRMTGWGQESPLSDNAGHDLNYVGMSGAAWYTSDAGDPPFPPPSLLGDIGGGAMYLAVGLLAGILRARSTGQGNVIDAAMYDGSAHMMNLLMSLRQGGSFTSERGVNLLDGAHYSRSYRTSDGGFIGVQCLEPQFHAIFLDKLGLSDDPDFARQFDRDRWPVMTARLKKLFATRTRDEWAAVFLGSDACVAPILNPDEALVDDMNSVRKTWHEVDGVLQAAPAPRIVGAPDWIPPAIPTRGEHTDALLAELSKWGA